jgi:histidyl-tRNA synthetase
MNSKYLIILGDDEYQKGVVGIKNTKTEKQEEVVISKIKKYMTEKLEKK